MAESANATATTFAIPIGRWTAQVAELFSIRSTVTGELIQPLTVWLSETEAGNALGLYFDSEEPEHKCDFEIVEIACQHYECQHMLGGDVPIFEHPETANVRLYAVYDNMRKKFLTSEYEYDSLAVWTSEREAEDEIYKMVFEDFMDYCWEIPWGDFARGLRYTIAEIVCRCD